MAEAVESFDAHVGEPGGELPAVTLPARSTGAADQQQGPASGRPVPMRRKTVARDDGLERLGRMRLLSTQHRSSPPRAAHRRPGDSRGPISSPPGRQSCTIARGAEPAALRLGGPPIHRGALHPGVDRAAVHAEGLADLGTGEPTGVRRRRRGRGGRTGPPPHLTSDPVRGTPLRTPFNAVATRAWPWVRAIALMPQREGRLLSDDVRHGRPRAGSSARPGARARARRIWPKRSASSRSYERRSNRSRWLTAT